MSIPSFVLALLASNAFVGLVQFLISRYLNQKDTIKATLAAVSYEILADKLERSLDKGFATPEQRRDVKVLYDAYKTNHWNGDMDSRMAKFYSLPTKDLDEVYNKEN